MLHLIIALIIILIMSVVALASEKWCEKHKDIVFQNKGGKLGG
jgi:hypothetical protein